MSVEPEEEAKLVEVECIRCSLLTTVVVGSSIDITKICNPCWHKQREQEMLQRQAKRPGRRR